MSLPTDNMHPNQTKGFLRSAAGGESFRLPPMIRLNPTSQASSVTPTRGAPTPGSSDVAHNNALSAAATLLLGGVKGLKSKQVGVAWTRC